MSDFSLARRRWSVRGLAVATLALLIAGCGSSPAQLRSAPLPAYPEMLRQARIDGAVTVVVRIDEDGRADSAAVQVVDEAHSLFTSAVRRALVVATWDPARDWLRRPRAVATMHTYRWVLLTDSGAAGGAPACPAPSNDTTTVCGRRAREPTGPALSSARLDMVAAAFGWVRPSPGPALAELARNRERWRAARLSHYRYRHRLSCGLCYVVEGREDQLVTVRDGREQASRSRARRDDGPAGIEGIFAAIEVALRDSAYDVVDVTYHPTLGYPRSVTFDRHRYGSDDETHWTIEELTSLPHPAPPRRATKKKHHKKIVRQGAGGRSRTP